MKKHLLIALTCLTLFATYTLHAEDPSDEMPPQLKAEITKVDENVITVRVTISEGGYIYLKSEVGKVVTFTEKKGSGIRVLSVANPEGVMHDEDLVVGGAEGAVAEFSVAYSVAVENEAPAYALVMEYQMCLEAGMCLMPDSITLVATEDVIQIEDDGDTTARPTSDGNTPETEPTQNTNRVQQDVLPLITRLEALFKKMLR